MSVTFLTDADVDETYNPQSENAQSGKAVAEAVSIIKESLNDEIDKKIDGVPSKNLFNKKTVTSGYYLAGSGSLLPNASFSVSDFITVNANEIYTATLISNSNFYNSEKEPIGRIDGNTFTIPAGASYIRLSIENSKLNTFMLNSGDILLPYEDFGYLLGIENFSDELTEELSGKINSTLTDTDYLYHLREHLNNPFVPTQIKLVGDSITAGAGGTGYNPNGEIIGGTTNQKVNDLNAVCWSNMFYHYIDEMYNRNFEVDMRNEHIRRRIAGTSLNEYGETIGTETVRYYGILENNNIARETLNFDFYGTEVSLYFEKNTDKGITEIYIDDVLSVTVDCYSETRIKRDKITISNLTKDRHHLSVRATNTKNENSSGYQFIIGGVVLQKCAVVKPWGISGTTSDAACNSTGRYSMDDDFVILQYGTNDRFTHFSSEYTTKNLIAAGKLLKTTYGAEPIFMCSVPIVESHESSDVIPKFYHMWDIHDAVARASEYFKIPFIDNYQAFMDYTEQHNSSIEELSAADGLHPNDLGYKVIFNNLLKNLGLSRFPVYKEWPPMDT